MRTMIVSQSRSSLTPAPGTMRADASAELAALGAREQSLAQQLRNAEIRMKNYEADLARMSKSEQDLNGMTLTLRRQNVSSLRAELDQTHTRMQELLGDKPEPVVARVQDGPVIATDGPVPAMVGTVEAPHFFGLEPRQFREPAVFILLLPLILAFSRWIWRRTPARPSRENALAGNAQIDRLEQSVEAIAIEVERIGEAQRFSAKLMAERPQEPVIARSRESVKPPRRVVTPLP